jgi:hypothetical protein
MIALRSLGLLALSASGCGSVTADFIGSYTVSGVVSYSNGDDSPFSGSETITQAATSNEIVFVADQCDLNATVTTSQSFTVNQQTCPAYNYTDPACGACSFTLIYTGGTGSLSDNSLSLRNAGGTYTLNCTNGCSPQSGQFTLTFTGTKT